MLSVSSKELEEMGEKPTASKERVLLENAVPHIMSELGLGPCLRHIISDPSSTGQAAIRRSLQACNLQDKVSFQYHTRLPSYIHFSSSNNFLFSVFFFSLSFLINECHVAYYFDWRTRLESD
jgi:hypothetical protein